MKYLGFVILSILLAACGGGGGSSSNDGNNNGGSTGSGGSTGGGSTSSGGGTPATSFTVTTMAGTGGSITPANESVIENTTTTLTVTPDSGFTIDSVSGCNGSLSGNSYTTGSITSDCTVSASFTPVVVSTNSRVAYIAHDQTVTDTDGLYIVDSNGANPSRLNPDLVAGGNVVDYVWSGDGSRVIYRADQETDGRLELYSVLADGSGLVKLNADLLDGVGVTKYELSPSGDTIAYLARQDDALTSELYTVSIDGANNLKLNNSLVAGGNVTEFMWSPDGNRIVYLSDLESNDRFELYSVNLDGSNHQNVNDDLATDQAIFGYKWSPDSAYIAYVVEDNPNGFLSGSTNKAIYSYSLADSNNNTVLENQTIIEFVWRSDSAYIVIVSAHGFVTVNRRSIDPGYDDVWVASADGQSIVDVTQNIKSSASVFPTQYSFIPGSNSIAILSRDFIFGGTTNFNVVSLADGSVSDTEITTGLGGFFLNYNYFNDRLTLTNEQRIRYYDQEKYSPFTFSTDGRYIIINDTTLSIYDTVNTSLLELESNIGSWRSMWLESTGSILYFRGDGSFEPITFERFFVDPIIVSPVGSLVSDIDQLLGGNDRVARAVNPMPFGDDKIAFERFPTAQRPLGIVGTDGLNLTILSDETASDITDYQLTSDGQNVIYAQGCNGITPCLQSALYSVNLDGSNRTQINPNTFATTGIKSFSVQP